MSDIHKNYLLDLGRYIREAGTAAKGDAEAVPMTIVSSNWGDGWRTTKCCH